jgi:hypothetical protein
MGHPDDREHGHPRESCANRVDDASETGHSRLRANFREIFLGAKSPVFMRG